MDAWIRFRRAPAAAVFFAANDAAEVRDARVREGLAVAPLSLDASHYEPAQKSIQVSSIRFDSVLAWIFVADL